MNITILAKKRRKVKTLAQGVTHRTEFSYDQMGRLIKTLTNFKDHLNPVQTVGTKTFTTVTEIKQSTLIQTGIHMNMGITLIISCSPRPIRETHSTLYSYDKAGNKTCITDPLNRSTWFIYDDHYRLVKKILPDDTPPADPASDSENNPLELYTYDYCGNISSEETCKDKDTSGRIVTMITIRGTG